MKNKKSVHIDCVKNKCEYRLPHYHCAISNCGKRILIGDGDRRVNFHPCCSIRHVRLYNAIFFCSSCGVKLFEPSTKCKMCGDSNNVVKIPVIKSKPVTNIMEYKKKRDAREKNSP